MKYFRTEYQNNIQHKNKKNIKTCFKVKKTGIDWYLKFECMDDNVMF